VCYYCLQDQSRHTFSNSKHKRVKALIQKTLSEPAPLRFLIEPEKRYVLSSENFASLSLVCQLITEDNRNVTIKWLLNEKFISNKLETADYQLTRLVLAYILYIYKFQIESLLFKI
jgi:hypothetical protein